MPPLLPELHSLSLSLSLITLPHPPKVSLHLTIISLCPCNLVIFLCPANILQSSLGLPTCSLHSPCLLYLQVKLSGCCMTLDPTFPATSSPPKTRCLPETPSSQLLHCIHLFIHILISPIYILCIVMSPDKFGRLSKNGYYIA